MPKNTYKEIYRANLPNDDAAAAASRRDKKDSMVKTFMQFFGDEEDEMVRVKDSDLAEDLSAPAASTANTPGMGNVVAPTATTKGSGDVFGYEEEEDEDKKRQIKTFHDFIKKANLGNGKSK
jgi:hypothetical protein